MTNTNPPTKVYIAGPMRGIKFYNFLAFDAARDRLKAAGYDPVSPADLDRQIGFDPFSLPDDHDWSKVPDSFSLDQCIERDTAAIKRCDGIYMLKGWEHSIGARAEHALAEWLRLHIFFEADPAKTASQNQNANQEIRVTDPETGGQKGIKVARFDLIPPVPMLRLAEHYGKGAQKYADDNYRKGYRWKLSLGALQRHLSSFILGESIDAETGSHHLTAVIWHAIALQEFERLGLGTDDRYVTVEERVN